MTATQAPRVRNRLRDEVGGKFRILIGDMLGAGPPGCECDDCQEGRDHRYRARRKSDPADFTGDVIECDKDLERRFNAGPHSRKFERIHEYQEGTHPSEDALNAKDREIADLKARLAELEATKPVSVADAAKQGSGTIYTDQLEGLTVAELKAYADGEEIPLGGARTREEILKAIRAAK